MATSAGEIEVKLTLNADDFKKVMDKSQNDLKKTNDDMTAGIKSFALAAGAALVGLGAFLKSSLDAFGENQIAVNKLTNALQNQGIASQTLVNHLTGLATALQHQTGVSDEAIIQAQALLTTFGLQGAQMDKTVQSALDLSAALGIDLQQAATLLGKAFVGETGTLARYGIQVNTHIETSKKFAAVMDQVNARFGGSAAAQADTYSGKLNIMKQGFNDLQESIGRLLMVGGTGGLLGLLTRYIEATTQNITVITEFANQFKSFGAFLQSSFIMILGTMLLTITSLLEKFTAMMSMIPILGKAYELMNMGIRVANKAISDQIAAWGANSIAAATSAGKIKTYEEQKRGEIEQTKMFHIQEIDAVDKYTADKMAEDMKRRTKAAAEAKAAHEDFIKSFITTEADMWNEITSLSNSFFQGFGDGVAKIIVEGGNMAEVLQNLWRNLAEQIISYIIQIIAKMLVLMAIEAATGTSGIASAIGGSFSYAAEGGMINEPSLLVGLRSGKKIIAGEAGPEAIVPMNKTVSDVAGGMGGGGGEAGGGSITINISGQFLEADQATWQRLMRDKVIPEVRRFTMSSPTGPFNRRRGVV